MHFNKPYMESAEFKNLNFIRKFYYYIGLFPKFDSTFNLPDSTASCTTLVKPTILSTYLITMGVLKLLFDGSMDYGHTARVYLSLASGCSNFAVMIISWYKFSAIKAHVLGDLFKVIQEADTLFYSLKQRVPVVKCKWLIGILLLPYTGISFLGAYAFHNIGTVLIIVGGIDHMCIIYVGLINVLSMELLLMARNRFKSLNLFMKQLASPECQTSCITMDYVMKLHNKLGNFCELLNDLLGLQFLGYYFQTMFFTLSTILLAIGSSLNSSHMTTTLYSTLTIGFIQGIIIARFCDAVSTEGKKTISIICDYVNVHSHSNSFALNKMAYFLQQAREKSPKFTAASFFNIDNSLIFMFINLTATYVIVLIQFRNSDEVVPSEDGNI